MDARGHRNENVERNTRVSKKNRRLGRSMSKKKKKIGKEEKNERNTGNGDIRPRRRNDRFAVHARCTTKICRKKIVDSRHAGPNIDRVKMQSVTALADRERCLMLDSFVFPLPSVFVVFDSLVQNVAQARAAKFCARKPTRECEIRTF